MSQRTIKETREFTRGLKKLGKKHRGLASKIRDTLNDLASGGRLDGKRLKGYGELQLFKIRCGTGEVGRRKGARVIYYKNDSELWALYVYLKSDTSDVHAHIIKEILARYNIKPTAT